MNNADMPVHPSDMSWETSKGEQRETFTGITLREHFAGLAMQAIGYDRQLGVEITSGMAVEMADALLAALEDKPLPPEPVEGKL